MLNVFKKFWAEESGQGMAEYGLILALVAVAAVAALALLGGNLGTMFDSVAGKIKPTQ